MATERGSTAGQDFSQQIANGIGCHRRVATVFISRVQKESVVKLCVHMLRSEKHVKINIQ